MQSRKWGYSPLVGLSLPGSLCSSHTIDCSLRRGPAVYSLPDHYCCLHVRENISTCTHKLYTTRHAQYLPDWVVRSSSLFFSVKLSLFIALFSASNSVLRALKYASLDLYSATRSAWPLGEPLSSIIIGSSPLDSEACNKNGEEVAFALSRDDSSSLACVLARSLCWGSLVGFDIGVINVQPPPSTLLITTLSELDCGFVGPVARTWFEK